MEVGAVVRLSILTARLVQITRLVITITRQLLQVILSRETVQFQTTVQPALITRLARTLTVQPVPNIPQHPQRN